MFFNGYKYNDDNDDSNSICLGWRCSTMTARLDREQKTILSVSAFSILLSQRTITTDTVMVFSAFLNWSRRSILAHPFWSTTGKRAKRRVRFLWGPSARIGAKEFLRPAEVAEPPPIRPLLRCIKGTLHRRPKMDTLIPHTHHSLQSMETLEKVSRSQNIQITTVLHFNLNKRSLRTINDYPVRILFITFCNFL